MKPEEFVSLLNNDLVQEAFSKILKPIIELTITELIKPLEKEIGTLTASLKILQAELNAKEAVITTLESTNTSLREDLAKAEVNIDSLEQYTRRDNLVITGIPQTFLAATSASLPDARRGIEDTSATIDNVVKLFNDVLHIPVKTEDISIAHHLKVKKGQPPVVVRFVRRAMRDTVFRARMILKTHNDGKPMDQQIFINEDLTVYNRKLFTAVRKKVKNNELQSAWTSACRVHVKTLTGGFITVNDITSLNSL